LFSARNPKDLRGTHAALPRAAITQLEAETAMTTSRSSAASLSALREEATHCRACDLWKHATQTVFGEGPAHAQVMLVGEQPGDKEDLAGHPFVGPAGQMLDRALDDAGVDRNKSYVTNAVKHFKFDERGKRRIHKKPSDSEITACRPWLEAELARIQPEVIVCLGATARAVIGKQRLRVRNLTSCATKPENLISA
jgi:uracil-DNA glycosylase